MNHTYRLVWNRALSMFVAVSESTRSMGKSGGIKAIGGAVAAMVAMAALPMSAHAQSTFLDFSSLAGWTTQGGTQVLTGTDAFTLEDQNYSLTPAAGNSMVKITAQGSSIEGAAAADTALGLSAGTIAALLGNSTTNFGLLSKSFTFNPGTYSFAWAYAAGDYQPFNDGVLFSVVGQGTQNVMSLARNGSSANDTSGPQASTLVLGSYGSTAWNTTSFNITTAGTYQVSYADYNWDDSSMDPVYYVSGVAGTFTGNAIVPVSGGTPAPVPAAITAGNPTPASGLAAGTVAPAFDGGTLAMDTPNATYAQNFTLSANGGTIDQSGTNSVFTGIISDAGPLHIVNSGNGGAVTLTAANTYTGATTVASGATLALSGAGAIASSSGVTLDGGALDIAGTDHGATVAQLTGVNGTVALGDKTLTINAAAGTFDGIIAGTGGVTIAGGNQTFAANNYYRGQTQIGAGATLALAGNGSVGNSSGVVVDGVFDLSGAARSNAAKALYGSGTVDLGDNFLALTGGEGAGSFGGTIKGTGGIAVFAGTQVLSGVNTYTSGTQVFAGATLALAGNGSIANSAGATVDGVLDVTNANGNVSVGSLGGAGNVILGANSLTLSGAYDTFTGNISGTGGLTVAAGNETLTSANSYTGATQVNNNGKLALSGDGSIAQSKGVVLNGGTLDISATTAAGSTVQTLTGANGFVTLGSKTLTVTAASGTFGGTLFGSGGLTIAGGNQTITSGQSYTGTTTIGSGAGLTIVGNGGGIYNSGNVVNNGAIDVSGATFPTKFNNLSGTGTLALGATSVYLGGAGASFGGQISGTGSVIVDAARQNFSANNYYTGLTQIGAASTLALTGNGSVGNSSGVVVGGVLDLTGAAPSNAVKALYGNGTVNLGSNFLALTGGTGAGNFGGAINGSGGIAVFGGTQVLSGANTYTSGTQVFAGATLALAGNGSIANSAGATVDGVLDMGSANGNVSVGSLGGAGKVVLGANSLTLNGAYDTFTGNISGTGGLTVAAGNETLTSANSYTGVTQVNSSGKLALSGDGSIAQSKGVVLNGGTLDISATTGAGSTVQTLTGANGFVTLGSKTLTVNAASGTFGGTLFGSGSLTIAGGNQTITSGQSYTGTTIIDSGAGLTIVGNGGGIYNSGNVVNNGAIDVSGATFPTKFNNLSGTGTLALGATSVYLGGAGANFGGQISGTGSVVIDAANQTFSANNYYTGLTQIGAASTLALTGNGSVGNSSGVVVGGVLDLTGAAPSNAVKALYGNGTVNLGSNFLALTGGEGAGSFGGTIAGSGGLAVFGGTQVLSGVNTYTAGTQVFSGATLALTGNGSIASSASAIVDGVLDVGNANGNVGVGSLGGAGNVLLGANTLVLTSAHDVFGGNIAGTGGLTVAGGIQTINAGLTYSGATRVDTGAKLIILGAGGVNQSSNVLNNGTIDVAGATAASFSNLAGAGTLALGATTTTLTGAGANFGGTIAGSGGVTVAAARQTLSGVNTYTGATQVATGATLALTDSRGIAASSGVTANGTLDISATSAGASIASLDGNGAVVLGDKQLVLSNASGSFGGSISGTGGLFVNAGTQALTGVNSYTGNTQIDTGATLAIVGNGAITSSGGVLNNGTLTIASTLPSVMTSLAGSGVLNLVNQSITFTKGADNFTGSITGTGTMSVTGGVQQLSGANTISGPVSATSGGTLRVASDASLGATSNGIVLDNGTLNTTGSLTMARAVSITNTGTALVNSGTTLVANGAISGSGTLVKSGAGTLVLGADNSALKGGAVIDGGTVTLAAANAAGTGALTLKNGTLDTAVNLTLAQNIAIAGGTSINTGAATTTVLAGTVSTIAGGTGCFSKTGAGTLNVTGAASFSAGLCVQEGTLRINGLTNANLLAVSQGATLRGAGSISAPVTVGGTLAPGNSPGTLTSSATVTMLAGSTFQEDINGTGTASGPGNYSRLLIAGAGQFVAGGATLTPNLTHITGTDTYTPYVPKVGDNFRIVTAAGGLVGRFGTIVQPEGLAANTRLAAFYNGDASHSIDLRVLPSSYAAYGVANGGNGNTQVSGVALDKILTADQAGTATAQQAAVAYAVSNVGGSSVVNLAQNLAGEVHGAMAAAAPLAGQAVQGAVLRQLDGSSTNVTSALWADLAANRAEWSGDSLASGFAANRGQLTVGVDAFRNDAGRIGVGFSHARANLVAEGGSGTLRENLAFVYGNYQGAGLGIDAMAGASRTNWETERANPLGAGALQTGLDGRNTLASIGISAPWQVDGATFKPFVRVLWQRTERDAGTEGTALAALALGEFSASGTRATAGLSGNVKGGSFGQTPYTMQYSVGAGRDNGNLVRAVVDSSIAGVGTSILAPHAGRSFVQAAVSGTILHSANASSFYGVATELHGGRTDVSLSGGLRYAF